MKHSFLPNKKFRLKKQEKKIPYRSVGIAEIGNVLKLGKYFLAEGFIDFGLSKMTV